eukprot:3225015-Pyramimonas_sp.AAC.2
MPVALLVMGLPDRYRQLVVELTSRPFDDINFAAASVKLMSSKGRAVKVPQDRTGGGWGATEQVAAPQPPPVLSPP